MILQGKVILITGASRGIGAAVARTVASHGAKVVVNYAGNTTLAEAVVRSITEKGGEARSFRADVSKPEAVKAMFDFTIAQFGRIDVLINNAGVMTTVPIRDSTDADFTAQFDINVKGVFNTLREAALRIADNGIIINFSSSTTKMMLPGYAIYAATKAAVEQLTRVFSKEIGRGVSVNAIAPGPTDTELFMEGKSEETVKRLASMNAFNRIATPDDIARVVVFLASDDSKWLSGQVIPVNGAMV